MREARYGHPTPPTSAIREVIARRTRPVFVYSFLSVAPLN
jgi:hypothetical protein